jgi:DNA polymerase-3 subunit chi
MTKVNFYILNSGSREQTACKLIEKAYTLGHSIYVHTVSQAQAKHLDDLLWTFRDGSFIPHEYYEAGKVQEAPILIGDHEAPDVAHDVLINLSEDVPLFFSRFLRVAEVVGHDDAAKQQGRKRFKFYKDRGYALDTYPLG